METSQNTPPSPLQPPSETMPTAAPVQITQPIQQNVSSVQTTGSISDADLTATTSDKRFYLVVAFIAILVVSIGGYFMYQSYLRSASTSITGTATETEAISDFTEKAAPQKKDLAEYNYVTPPEGDDILLHETNETVIPKPMQEYINYQFSFAFEYEDKPVYQTLQCYASGVNETTDTENKFVFYDSSNISSNEALYAQCSPSTNNHLAKVMFTEVATECLGTSETRTVSTGTAVQCSGKTSSASSNDSSLSLIIPKDSGSVLVEVNDPRLVELLQDVAASISFETPDEPPVVEEN